METCFDQADNKMELEPPLKMTVRSVPERDSEKTQMIEVNMRKKKEEGASKSFFSFSGKLHVTCKNGNPDAFEKGNFS